MSEILSHQKVDEYYREGLKYPAFINTLNEYQQRKVLEVCEDSIRKGSFQLYSVIELNLDNLNERNLDVAREVIMGKQLRLRNALWLALGILKKDEPMQQIVPSVKEREHQKTEAYLSELNDKVKELVAALNNRLEPEQKESTTKKESPQALTFSSFLNEIHSEEKMAVILEIGKHLPAYKLASFLFALEAEGILKKSFLEIQLINQLEMVIEQFSYNSTKAGLSSAIIECKGKARLRIRDMNRFRVKIQGITNE
jgi:hypothetical protein